MNIGWDRTQEHVIDLTPGRKTCTSQIEIRDSPKNLKKEGLGTYADMALFFSVLKNTPPPAKKKKYKTPYFEIIAGSE